MAYDTQAQELNVNIKKTNPHVFNILSERGKGIYFPKQGILSQTAEAQSCTINATIGMSYEDTNQIMYLPSVVQNLAIAPHDAVSYTKGSGKPELRKKWQELMIQKNPSLSKATISLPVVTSALTHGHNLAGYLFIDPGDIVLLPEHFWGNYALIYQKTWYAKFITFPTFNENGKFNCSGLEEVLHKKETGKKVVILNFPNNPIGYSPAIDEAKKITKILVESAEEGNEILVIIDDAYFGLVYEPGILKESIFSYLANAHENILAVKLDGPTKEDYVWGFRVGFVTFGTKLNSKELYTSLETKMAGAIRATVSSVSHLSQSLLYAAYTNDNYEKEKAEKFETLQMRYREVKKIIQNHKEYSDVFTPLPFNSGYFLCVACNDDIDTEEVRQLLIQKYDTGIIALGNLIRIAFSSTPLQLLEKLFKNIYLACKEARIKKAAP